MFVEKLETRTLLSSAAINGTIAADRAQVWTDLGQFKTDIVSGITTISADLKAIKTDDAADIGTVGPLVKTFHTDANAMRATLLGERLQEKANVLNDQANIVTELEQYVADKGNKSARATDKSQILADRVDLENDEIAGLTARINTRQADYNKLEADLTAIATAVENDESGSTQLSADVTRFVTDRTNVFSTLLADLQTIKNDRTKLAKDLMAIESLV
jgi:hypothetical protein